MIKLCVRNLDTRRTEWEQDLKEDVYAIGRTDDNDIVLNDPTVSAKHATLQLRGNEVYVTDLKSTNFTYVAGESVFPERKTPIPLGQPVVIGLFELTFSNDEVPSTVERAERDTIGRSSHAVNAIIDQFKAAVQEQLFKRLDLVRLEAQRVDQTELRRRARDTVAEIVREMRTEVPAGKTEGQIAKEILDEALGLGPLEELLEDKCITEIMVVRRDQIYVERNGRIVLSDARFSSDAHLRHAIERIVSSKGRRIDELHPYVDTRLDDGSRVNAVIPPVAIDGPVLTIRKFPETRLGVDELVGLGSLTDEMARFLQVCVRHRHSTLISGGTGSGKTTLLNALAAFIPHGERLITVEDSAELNLPQQHVVRMEARPANIEGRGQITIRDLVKNCLRMRPDRIIVGECRGGEAIDMLQAMNTGHDGSMTTLHANTPRDAISRLTTMCLMSDLDLPSRSIQEQIASAISLIVQTTRMADGSRRVVRICEVVGINDVGVEIDTIFRFRETGFDNAGHITGRFECEKTTPLVFEQMAAQRVQLFELGRSHTPDGSSLDCRQRSSQ